MLVAEFINTLFDAELPEASYWESAYPPRDLAPGAMTEYMKSEDYDRIVSGGEVQSDFGDAEDTQSYDIF